MPFFFYAVYTSLKYSMCFNCCSKFSILIKENPWYIYTTRSCLIRQTVIKFKEKNRASASRIRTLGHGTVMSYYYKIN